MLRARSANLSVAQVSSKAKVEGDMVAMMVVLQFPPRESCSKWVNLESLQGKEESGCADDYQIAHHIPLTSSETKL